MIKSVLVIWIIWILILNVQTSRTKNETHWSFYAIWRCSKFSKTKQNHTKSNFYHPSVEILDFHLPKFTLWTFWYLNHRGEIWSHDSWPWGTAVSWKFSTSFQQCRIAKFWCQWSVWSLNSFRFKRMDPFLSPKRIFSAYLVREAAVFFSWGLRFVAPSNSFQQDLFTSFHRRVALCRKHPKTLRISPGEPAIASVEKNDKKWLWTRVPHHFTVASAKKSGFAPLDDKISSKSSSSIASHTPGFPPKKNGENWPQLLGKGRSSPNLNNLICSRIDMDWLWKLGLRLICLE